jgi:hypothetical protein
MKFIEILFGSSPDHGNGLAEIGIAIALVAVAAVVVRRLLSIFHRLI